MAFDLLRRHGPLWAPDGEGDGGTGEGGAGDGGAGDGGTGDGGAGDGGGDDRHGVTTPPDPFRPNYLPDRLFGKTDRETLELVSEDWKSKRELMAARGTVPDKAEDYVIELSESAAKAFPIGADDKVIPLIKEAAKQFNISEKEIGFVGAMVDKMVEAGVVQPPQDISEVYRAAAPADFSGPDADREAAGQKRMQSLEAQIDGLTGSGFSKEEMGEMKLLLTSVAGVSALERIFASGVNPSANPRGQGTADGLSEADLMARKADPRADRNSPSYDPGFAKDLEQDYRRFYGN